MAAHKQTEQTDEAIVAEVVDRVADKFPAANVAQLTAQTRAALEPSEPPGSATFCPSWWSGACWCPCAPTSLA